MVVKSSFEASACRGNSVAKMSPADMSCRELGHSRLLVDMAKAKSVGVEQENGLLRREAGLDFLTGMMWNKRFADGMMDD